jgi:glycosyltransferase involved in cell wall biosynthesis
VCITQYNDARTVKQSIDALLNQTDERFEVVVVDQRSTDGSRQLLQGYADEGKIRLFDMQIRNRGLGREFAFENSRGRYIISGMDTDDIAIPGRLSQLLDFYHNRCEGDLLRLQWSGVVVASAELIRRVGGWRDAHWHENWDICERAARIGKYVWTIFRVKNRAGLGLETQKNVVSADLVNASLIEKNRVRYRKYVDELRLRIRRRPLEEGEAFGIGKSIDYVMALISLPYFGHLNSADTNFDGFSPEHFVDSSQWWHRSGQDESMEIRMYSRLLKKTPDWITTA